MDPSQPSRPLLAPQAPYRPQTPYLPPVPYRQQTPYRQHTPYPQQIAPNGPVLGAENNHPNSYSCSICHGFFASGSALDLHLINKHYWCRRCSRGFSSKNALEEHRQNSSKHFDFQCQMCQRELGSAHLLQEHHLIHQFHSCVCGHFKPRKAQFQMSTVILHWESANCSIKAGSLNEIIFAFPEKGALVVEGFGEPLLSLQMRVARDRQRSASPDHTRKWSRTIECRHCRKEFRSSKDLDQHIASPVHTPRVFKCPNTACGDQFLLLSSLFLHAEKSNACLEGITTGTGCLGRLWVFLESELRKLGPNQTSLTSFVAENKPQKGPIRTVERVARSISRAIEPSLAESEARPQIQERQQWNMIPGLTTLTSTDPSITGMSSLSCASSPQNQRHHSMTQSQDAFAALPLEIERCRTVQREFVRDPRNDSVAFERLKPVQQLAKQSPSMKIQCPQSSEFPDLPNANVAKQVSQHAGKIIAAAPSTSVEYVINEFGRLEGWKGTPEQAGLPVFKLVGISAPVSSLLPEEFIFETNDT